ncbi:SDR family oxidoreductase [Amycolatopsis sp. PS_44_ISF1]|uniref:SDR family NAD(P)-dependent oxidoreductase n=1 Tax=Amycolatopsis sp. PS_44_ISF1 TaxID=2974917 RepID=UPI0028DFEE9B|nr:SDR family oxidoreductase [Amycolatopsis sp. PS_44_ISF1]MDT8913315.1 SDR family oxidoreductase [Amycolatopsis sp. PS_44_ISF1]
MPTPAAPHGPRRVLITGASRGIGRATAVAFAGQGDRVAVHYAAGRAGAEETLSLLPGSGHALVQGDLGEPGAAERIVGETVAALGGIDVLVNNAAVAPSAGNEHRPATTPHADWRRVWRRMVEVNLLGAVDLTHLVAQHLIDRGAGGRIVNVGSRGAFRGEPDFPAYGTTKAALQSFGQSMAIALAPHGIAVTSVAPGFVATGRQAAKLAEDGAAIEAQSPFGRVGTPEEVADAVRYLASAPAVWASGAILDLNGASHLRS